MKSNFINKKSLILLSAVLVLCLSINAASFAETLQDNILNHAKNQTTQELMPAINKTGEEKEKNTIPVLDLKGSIQEQESKKETPFKIWLNQDNLTGDWQGLRPKLKEHGIAITSSYMINGFAKGNGGGLIKKGKGSYQGVINTGITLDTEKMGLYPGGKLSILFENIHGKGLSEKYVGDILYFNSYESPRPGPQLSEYYYEQKLLSDRLKVKIGKQDANIDFMALDTGFDFINSGFSLSVSSNLPTYPNTAMGLITIAKPGKNVALKYGLFDAHGVGSQSGFNTFMHRNSRLLHTGEIEFTHSLKGHAGKYLIGTWHNNKPREEFLSQEAINSGAVAETFQSTNGVYSEFEQMIFKEKHDNFDDKQGLNLLGQFSWAPPNNNEITKYFGTALSYRGLIPKRDADVLGVGFNSAKFTKRISNMKGESVLEVFYKICLTPWLFIEPDFQWINKPRYADKSTVVFGIRTVINF